MPVYRVRRHVIYRPGSQQTSEVWGIDREAPGLYVAGAPRDTDADDPLGRDCALLLQLRDGRWVTWEHIFEWISEAETAGYAIVSGFEKLSPYSTLIIKGPLP